jgi:short-subunit dehydrogenase
METKKHQGETALITGATDGIGLELARCCAKDGYNVILVARTQEDLDRTAQELTSQYGIRADVIAIDLMEPNAAFGLYEKVKAKATQIDILINDAGQGVYGAFTGTDIEKELQIIQLNIGSLTILTKLFLKEMVARDSGKILQLASVASKSSTPYMAVYGATKAYIYNFTQALISELEDSKVTITALLPGPTDTDFFNKAGSQNIVAVKEGALADPADVAKDGYEAMQSGDSKVVSGWKNKMQTAMGNLLPDEVIADQSKKQNELSNKE